MCRLAQALIALLFTALFAISLAVVHPVETAFRSNPLVANAPDVDLALRILRGLRQDVADRGCNVNICFAVQGDGFITPISFFDQINFLDLIANILTTDNTGGLSAVQYGRLTNAISPLTDNRQLFADRLDATTQVGGEDSNLAAALGYCAFQLRARPEDANKIVLFADGFESVGILPKTIAERIREDKIQICAVGVGEFSVSQLLDIVASPNLIIEIDGYFELLEIISALVFDICGL